jgi:hypothetical protein
MTNHEQRLRRAVEARLESDESILSWTRAWVSTDRRLHFLLAARHRDFAVVTDRRLMLWSCGFFTRAPRRRVLAERLDEIRIEANDSRRRFVCTRAGRPDLVIELGTDARAGRFFAVMRDAAQRARPGSTPAEWLHDDADSAIEEAPPDGAMPKEEAAGPGATGTGP